MRCEAVGVFGGTFDPVHYGHLRAAVELREALGLAQVRMLPARVPPHRGEPCAAPHQRLAMLERAVAGAPELVVDRRELARSGPSYMVDTLASLRAELGAETPLCLLLGADAFLGVSRWHRWRELLELAHIGVAHRPGWQLGAAAAGPEADLLRRLGSEPAALRAAPAGRIATHAITPLDISATAVRALLAAGRTTRFLLPDAVRDYIVAHGLYLTP